MQANTEVQPQTVSSSRLSKLWQAAVLGVTTATLGVFGSSLEAKQPFHPFAESLDVDPDYQWFAPVDVYELEELSGRKRAGRGWFVGYDRLHIGFDRPDTNGVSSRIDMTWGNRWDFGYMGDSETGWLFSATSVSGPNVYNDLRERRASPPVAGTVQQILPFDPDFGDGTYVIRQSVNVGTLSSFEANKTWRKEPYRYGGIVEPMLGFRYVQFNDYAVNNTLDFLNVDTDPNVDIESFGRQITRTDNRMVLGQIGYRYFSSIKRMTFSQESRFFAGQNFQTQGFETRTSNINVPGDNNLVPSSASFSRRENNEFVVGLDARIEAAMQLTKAFNFRAGMQVLYFGRGVWRGANPGLGNQNLVDQALVSPAFTFGAAFNR